MPICPSFLRLRWTSLILAAAVTVGATAAAPEPQPVPTRWEFDFQQGPLRVALVTDPELGTMAYYYLTYRVTNRWGTDLFLAPDVQLKLGNGDLLTAGRGVPPAVTDELLTRLDSPLIEDQISMVGSVLQGEENARDGLLVWPAASLKTKDLTLFFAGLSGENQVLVVDRDGPNPKRFVLRKTLMLRYETPGELGSTDNEVIALSENRWIMR